MSLQGTLDTFALTEVLTLLSSTKKKGELKITASRLQGSLWLDGGQLVGADVPRAPRLVDAVFEILRLVEGAFIFNGESEPLQPMPAEAVERVLTEAQERLVEWREIEAVVPSLNVAVWLAAEPPAETVTLAAHQWRVMVGVAAGRPLATVADELSLGEFEACRTVKELVEAGLAGIQELAQQSPSVMAPAISASAGIGGAAPPPPAAAPVPAPPEAAPVHSIAAQLGGSAPEAPAAVAPPPPPPTPPPAAPVARSLMEDVLQQDAPAAAPAAPAAVPPAPVPATPAPQAPAAEAPAAEPEAEAAEAGAEAPAGAEVDRGALLKFLSSVRN